MLSTIPFETGARRRRRPMGGPTLSRFFLRLTARAQRTMWRLKDQGLTDAASQNQYDRALVLYSICHQLWGQRFLWEREHLSAVLDELPVHAAGIPFDAARFDERWRTALSDLAGRCA